MKIRFIASTMLALLSLSGTALAEEAKHGKTVTARATSASLREGAQPFLRDAGDMTHVADMVDASLAKRANGTSPISETLCAKARSCITPLELFTQIKSQHPNVSIGNDVHDLATYLRTLVKIEHPAEGKRRVGRVIVKNGMRTMDYGYSRGPAPGEAIWTDVNTGEEVLMGNCLNTIDLTTLSEVTVTAWDCDRIVVEARPGDRGLNFALMGLYKPDVCFSYAYLGNKPKLSEDDDTPERLPLPTHCPDKICTFAQYEQITGLPITQSGGMSLRPGFYEFGVSREFAKNPRNLAVFCIEHATGAHGCGIDVHSTDYHATTARIYYTREETPADGTRKLWWAMPDAKGNCPSD